MTTKTFSITEPAALPIKVDEVQLRFDYYSDEPLEAVAIPTNSLAEPVRLGKLVEASYCDFQEGLVTGIVLIPEDHGLDAEQLGPILEEALANAFRTVMCPACGEWYNESESEGCPYAATSGWPHEDPADAYPIMVNGDW